MITLIGFAASNYYNKVRLALLEKGVRFDEELAWAGETDLAASPLGKVPYLRTPDGMLCESSAINEYIEAAFPQVPLLPAEPYAAAKVRELVIFLELHLELVARNLYAEAFFGGKVSDGLKQLTAKQLTKNIAAFGKLARFDTPFIAGEQLTLADCAAVCHLPLVSNATKIIYGQDFLSEQLPATRDYLKRLNARPHVQTVNADRKTNTEEMLKRYA